MKANTKHTWETPELRVHGTVEDITAQEGKADGTADVPFPETNPGLTASEPA